MDELKDIRSVFFLGIGGIGMSALAEYFFKRGVKVNGYDRVETPLTQQLAFKGVQISYEDKVQGEYNPDLIIYTPAIRSTSHLMQHFANSGIKMMKRSEVLGLISSSEKTIAIAGTHGKTTTTAMVSHILYYSGIEVTGFVGGIMSNYDSNYIDSGSEYIVAEADEFDRSFLTLTPAISAVLSMDADHLDIYGGSEEVTIGFKDFINKTKKGGTIYLHRSVIKNFTSNEWEVVQQKYKCLTFGDKDSDIFASNILPQKDGSVTFDLNYKTRLYTGLQLSMPGNHNVSNATVAMAIALEIGISIEKVTVALAAFKGIKRRFEYVVQNKLNTYIDDYAHHPEELRNAIATAKDLFQGKEIYGIFQPHLFSRTRDFADGFARELDQLDYPILMEIYPARELPIENVNSQMILDRMTNPNKQIMSFKEILEFVNKNKPEVLMTLGAGDIDTIVPKIKIILS